MEQEQIQKKISNNKPFWALWSIAAVIILAVFAFYGWKAWWLARENQMLEKSIKTIETQIQVLAPGSTEIFLEKQAVALTKAETFRINWSEIMKQLLELETESVRFSSLSFDTGKVSAICQANSWSNMSNFIKILKEDSRVDTVRISKTTVLSPAIQGATQEAALTFSFSPSINEDK